MPENGSRAADALDLPARQPAVVAAGDALRVSVSMSWDLSDDEPTSRAQDVHGCKAGLLLWGDGRIAASE